MFVIRMTMITMTRLINKGLVMTYYEQQFARLGEIDQYDVTIQFHCANGRTNHLTLSAEAFEQVKALLLTIEKAKQ